MDQRRIAIRFIHRRQHPVLGGCETRREP
jgi:hypothetical protein